MLIRHFKVGSIRKPRAGYVDHDVNAPPCRAVFISSEHFQLLLSSIRQILKTNTSIVYLSLKKETNTPNSRKMAPKVLVVLTSFDKIEANNHPTGWYLVRNTLTLLYPSAGFGH